MTDTAKLAEELRLIAQRLTELAAKLESPTAIQYDHMMDTAAGMAKSDAKAAVRLVQDFVAQHPEYEKRVPADKRWQGMAPLIADLLIV